MRSVVVTGLGWVTCLGRDDCAVESALRELRHGIRLYEPFADAKIPVKVAAPVVGFTTETPDPEDWEHPGEIRFRVACMPFMPCSRPLHRRG